MAEASNRFEKWQEVWRLFDADEQQDACLCLVRDIAEQDYGADIARLVKRIAEGTGSRIPKVIELAKSDPDRIAHTLRTRAQALFDHGSWKSLFSTYYFARKCALMCAFLDQLGIAHSEQGGIDGEYETPTSDRITAAVTNLLRIFQAKEIGRYLAVLALHEPHWECVADERDKVLHDAGVLSGTVEASAVSQGETVAESSPEFTVLDRVVIDQIVRAAMDVQGSLDPASLEELVRTLSRLNEKWHRAYFFLGLMDVLLAGREVSFDHPGDNDQRRWWYLAGVIAGLVRGHDLDRLAKVMEERQEDFARAVQQPGGAGGAIAKIAFKPLVERELIAESLQILRGQLTHVGLLLGDEALQAATMFIRQSRYGLGKPIIEELRRHDLQDEDEKNIEIYRLAVARRWGQCLQAEGNFEAAEQEFRKLLDAEDPLNSPDLLADLGLVKGRLRSITEIRLPERHEDRIRLRDTLQKGEEYFKKSIEQFGTQATKAAYALATLTFLRWVLSAGNDEEKEKRREQAASLSSAAITAIQSFDSSAAYREIGALGQCQFMLAVSKMNSFDDMEGQEALTAWKSITEDAGRLPGVDIRRLLEGAKYQGEAIADSIAESVWNYRKDDAYEILSEGPWMTRSIHLRAAMVDLARREHAPRSERINTWCKVIPVLVRAGDYKAAEEGLAQLEELAEDPGCTQIALDFLATTANYDPVLHESDAAWMRIHLLRRLGKDMQCEQQLRQLFYLVRDSQPWEVEQVLGAAEDWKLDAALIADLKAAIPQSAQIADVSIESRLASGENVRIIFFGGNETQARYDDSLTSQLKKEWPSVEVQFEHTGWSANWGRDLERLTRLGNAADAVVMMVMMRTILGRRLRAGVKKPWISCNATGKGGMLASLRRACIVGLKQKSRLQ